MVIDLATVDLMHIDYQLNINMNVTFENLGRELIMQSIRMYGWFERDYLSFHDFHLKEMLSQLTCHLAMF